jgi:hypothetical protein
MDRWGFLFARQLDAHLSPNPPFSSLRRYVVGTRIILSLLSFILTFFISRRRVYAQAAIVDVINPKSAET